MSRSKPTYKEGDPVRIKNGFGNFDGEGVVLADYDGSGRVVVRVHGKKKTVATQRVQLITTEDSPRSSLNDPTAPRTSAKPTPARRAVRQGTTAPVKLNARPKPKGPFRSESYKRFVASHPCCGCGTTVGVEAHHWAERRAMGVKVDDTRTVPLCGASSADCHGHYHAHGRLKNLDAIATRLLFLERQAQLQTAWIRALHERNYVEPIDPISQERPELAVPNPPRAPSSGRSSEVRS